MKTSICGVCVGTRIEIRRVGRESSGWLVI